MSDRELFGLFQARAQRRAGYWRQAQQEVKDIVEELDGPFAQRAANMWSLGTSREARRKIIGHAGHEASLYVSDILSEYHIPGTVRSRPTHMYREAGTGGHGITAGSLEVEVEINPIRGLPQRIEVPIRVEHGYMVEPGIFYYQGVPHILSQSSIDSVLSLGQFGTDAIFPERSSMYGAPQRFAERVAAPLKQKDIAPRKDEVERYEEEQRDRALAEQRRKQRRLQQTQQTQQTNQNVPIVRGTPVKPGVPIVRGTPVTAANATRRRVEANAAALARAAAWVLKNPQIVITLASSYPQVRDLISKVASGVASKDDAMRLVSQVGLPVIESLFS